MSAAWAVLCQVTASAAGLASSFSDDRLKNAYESCLSGAHGRTRPRSSILDLRVAVTRYFGTTTLSVTGHVQRVVVAEEFGDAWPDIANEFAMLDPPSLARHVDGPRRGTRPNRALERILALAPQDLDKVRRDVWWSTVENQVS